MTMENAISELEKARSARKSGFVGKSRVLARRAAGLAIRDYLRNQYPSLAELALNDLLKDQTVRELVPKSIHAALDRLTTRVNLDYQLPAEMDLLMDAEGIINILQMEMGENE